MTRKAVELALEDDPAALRLCIERILPPCRERAVKFALPPNENAADIAAAMNAVTAALARGIITPGEAERIAKCGRHLRPGARYNQKERVCCRSAADFGIGKF